MYALDVYRVQTQLMTCFPVWSNQELPEQAYLHPPLTLFVVEQRAFGRLALVGSHVVQSLMDYSPPELGREPEEEEEEPKPKGKCYLGSDGGSNLTIHEVPHTQSEVY